MNAPVQFGKVALRGSLVTGVSQGMKIGLQFLSVIVLARLLVPEDFGLVAAVGPVVAFVALFQNLGLQQAIVQRHDISDQQLNRMFWVMAAVGLACTAIVLAVSPLVAWFYGDPRMRDITIAAGVPLLLGSMAGLPLSLLNRHLRFGQLAMIDIANALFGFLAAATGAYYGLGYWSLLLGSAASAAVSLAVAWYWSRWMPGRPDFRIDRDIMSFGANLTGFNLANFFARNLDNILIGKYAGAIELGYYDRAYKLLLFPIQNIIAPLSRVMIPLLSRVQDDKPRFRELYLQTAWLLAFITVPGVAALTCTVGAGRQYLVRRQMAGDHADLPVAGPRRRGSIRQQFDGMGVHLPGQDQNLVPLGRVRLRHHHRRVHRRAAMGRSRGRRSLRHLGLCA